jgi:hypothetical protein
VAKKIEEMKKIINHRGSEAQRKTQRRKRLFAPLYSK